MSLSEQQSHRHGHIQEFHCQDPTCNTPGNMFGSFRSFRDWITHEYKVHTVKSGRTDILHCPVVICGRHKGTPFTKRKNMTAHVRRQHREPVLDSLGDSDEDEEEELEPVEDDHVHQDGRNNEASSSRSIIYPVAPLQPFYPMAPPQPLYPMGPSLYTPTKRSFPTEQGSYREPHSQSASSPFSARSQWERDADYQEAKRLRETVEEKTRVVVEKDGEITRLRKEKENVRDEKNTEIAGLNDRIARLEGAIQLLTRPSDQV